MTTAYKRHFPDDDNCPVRDVLSVLTSKWPMLILFALLDGVERFSGLQRRIENISKRMLTVSLRQLERDGYITRTVYPEVPPRVEYRLTPLGEDVVTPLIDLIHWAEKCSQNCFADYSWRNSMTLTRPMSWLFMHRCLP